MRLGAVHGPGAFPHLLDRELNPISFSCEFLLLCKGPLLPDLRKLGLHEAVRFCSFHARDPNHEKHSHDYFIPKGLERPMRIANAGAKSGATRMREAGEPGLCLLLLKGKSLQSASSLGGQFCRGRDSWGPLQRDLRKRAPLFRASSR